MHSLDADLQAYEAALPKMLTKNEGKFVVVHGGEICEIFPTYERALNWAYDQFGLDRFFVKQIAAEEATAHFSRDIGPCGA